MAEKGQNQRLDIVILGATGFTGQYAVEDLIKTIDKENKGLSWAVAGRNGAKCRQVLESAAKYLSKSLEDVPVIVVDVNDYNSVLAMCRMTRVVVNCVGPYRLYGENVVKASIEAGCHHVDLAGEPQFLEGMQIKYHKQAEEAGVLIVGACGFDSIPVDLGIYYLRDHFQGELHSVETYFTSRSGPSGGVINHGTWDSAVNALGAWSDLKDIRRELFTNFYSQPWPRFRHKLSKRLFPSTPPEVGKLCVPFWDTDQFVAKRTHLHNYIHNKERPVQVNNYMVVGSWLVAIGMGFVGMVFAILSQFAWGRGLLQDHPKIFSFGFVSKDGPTREQVNEGSFEVLLVGRGWGEKMAGPTDEPSNPPDKVAMARVKGPEAAYVATSTCLNQAAITLLQERDKIPFKGGVLTPGLAFRETTLVERLRRHSVVFEMIES